MTIQQRNRKMKQFKDNNKEVIEVFKNSYYHYYHYYHQSILLFEDFQIFWNEQEDRTCGYCGISESYINSDSLSINTKRFYSRGKTMEIDKKDAFAGYAKDNIILSCYWCNNAKTDEYSIQEFESIAKGINTIWNQRLKRKIIHFPEKIYKH